jgi:hypothetical protein
VAFDFAFQVLSVTLQVIAGVPGLGPDLVAGVADIVSQVMAIELAPGLFDVLLALAIGLLDVVHGTDLQYSCKPRLRS